ncbi:MAG: TonB-dependent receptor [Acidobacteria bacterium]|nr:MAG: TonB-dependent receptor [Acidobacteriota bacterium]
MTERIITLCAAIFILVFAPAATNAAGQTQTQQEPQEPRTQEEEEEEVEIPSYAETIVVTATRTEVQIIDAPATVSVITSDVIANSPAQNFGDLLSSVPGMNVTQTSARDINLTTRGATSTLATSQLALLDGRSIYLDFFGFVAWDFLPIDMSEIAQIDIIRGPASAVWGANAMTGVVNVITKTPREIDSTSVTFGFGAINRDAPGNELGTGGLFRANATHAQAVNDRWAYKVSAGFFSMDALPRPTGTIPVDPDRGTGGAPYPPFPNDGTVQPKFNFRVDYDNPDGRQKWIFDGGYGGTEGIIHTGIGPFQLERGTRMGYAKVNYLRDNWKVNFFANLLDGEAPALLAIGIDGRPINFLFNTQTYDLEVGNTQALGTKHLLTYGGNVRNTSFDLSIAPGDDSRNEVGFYVQDEIFISDHFRWLVGGRVDKFTVLEKAVFSPRTTFMIKPDRNHTFRVSYNRAFRAPSLVNNFLGVTILQVLDLGLINPALAGQQYVFPIRAGGNPDLREESLTAYEIGYTGTFANKYTVGVAFYVNDTTDNIIFTQSATYNSANPPPGWPLPPAVLDLLNFLGSGIPSQFTYLNFDEVRDKGVELSLIAQTSRELNVFVNYTFQAEPVTESSETLAELNFPSKNRFNLGFRYSKGRYFGNLSANYTDDAFWTDVLTARFHGPTDSYFTINGGFGVRWADDRITTAVKVTNLNNADVQQHIFGDFIKRQVVGEVRIEF